MLHLLLLFHVLEGGVPCRQSHCLEEDLLKASCLVVMPSLIQTIINKSTDINYQIVLSIWKAGPAMKLPSSCKSVRTCCRTPTGTCHLQQLQIKQFCFQATFSTRMFLNNFVSPPDASTFSKLSPLSSQPSTKCLNPCFHAHHSSHLRGMGPNHSPGVSMPTQTRHLPHFSEGIHNQLGTSSAASYLNGSKIGAKDDGSQCQHAPHFFTMDISETSVPCLSSGTKGHRLLRPQVVAISDPCAMKAG